MSWVRASQVHQHKRPVKDSNRLKLNHYWQCDGPSGCGKVFKVIGLRWAGDSREDIWYFEWESL